MSPTKNLARLCGLLYLIVIATGLFAEVFVRQAVSVPGDALATARNIHSSEFRFRLGFVADLVNLICGLPVIAFFYFLFRPVNRYLTTLAIFFGIICNTVIAVNLLHQLSPLILLGDEPWLAAIPPGQVAALVAHALALGEEGYAIALVFFGFYCIIFGWLIYQSRLLPRILGIGYALAGLCYIINSSTGFLMPGFRNPLFPGILLPSFIGELAVAVWLLIMGAKVLPAPAPTAA